MSSIMANRELFNAGLQSFAKFAIDGNHRADQAAGLSETGEVGAAKNAASWLTRHITCKAGKDSIDENNAVRNTFITALIEQFDVKEPHELPQSVLKALRGTYAKNVDSDFGCGKPLTQRRIHAVLTAVNQALGDSKCNQDIISAKKADIGSYREDMERALSGLRNSIEPELKKFDEEINKAKSEMASLNKKLVGIKDEMKEMEVRVAQGRKDNGRLSELQKEHESVNIELSLLSGRLQANEIVRDVYLDMRQKRLDNIADCKANIAKLSAEINKYEDHLRQSAISQQS